MGSALREPRIEAVIDALLAAADQGESGCARHARRIGAWAARLAQAHGGQTSPEFARRCGQLLLLPPEVIERVPEIADHAPPVRECQHLAILRPSDVPEACEAALILAVADELDALTYSPSSGGALRPSEALPFMERHACARTRPIVRALMRSLRLAS